MAIVQELEEAIYFLNVYFMNKTLLLVGGLIVLIVVVLGLRMLAAPTTEPSGQITATPLSSTAPFGEGMAEDEPLLHEGVVPSATPIVSPAPSPRRY